MRGRLVAIGLCALSSGVLLWHDLQRHQPPASIAIRRTHRLPGLTVAPMASAGQEPRRLVVTSRGSRAIATLDGVRVGDLIDSVDGHPVATMADLDRVLAADRNKQIVLRFHRGTEPYDVVVDRADETRR